MSQFFLIRKNWLSCFCALCVQIKIDILSSSFSPKLLFFKFHGIHRPRRGMTAPEVVKHFDVIDEILPGNSSVEKFYAKDLIHWDGRRTSLLQNCFRKYFLFILDSIPWFLSSFWKSSSKLADTVWEKYDHVRSSATRLPWSTSIVFT